MLFPLGLPLRVYVARDRDARGYKFFSFDHPSIFLLENDLLVTISPGVPGDIVTYAIPQFWRSRSEAYYRDVFLNMIEPRHV